MGVFVVGNRSMGLYSATSIGVEAMIGAGIFSIFGTSVQISGRAVYISFIIARMVALLNDYSYAKISVKYQSAGGLVEFILKGFGDGIFSGGFNLLLWINYVFSLALYSRGFSSCAVTFLPAGSAQIWDGSFQSRLSLFLLLSTLLARKLWEI